ncbi:hypothetical protein [Romboutsia weinsteinii]|uniref:hypothetical protein n=1 Tax=Romboutsia weinsteinii TaxID=2020949 RepID=UPI0013140CDE|nr:hypothetical protein [Romboutsia weinsteinii]
MKGGYYRHIIVYTTGSIVEQTMNAFFVFAGFICGIGIPLVCVVGSIVLLIAKICERQREKKEEDLDKYKKY